MYGTYGIHLAKDLSRSRDFTLFPVGEPEWVRRQAVVTTVVMEMGLAEPACLELLDMLGLAS